MDTDYDTFKDSGQLELYVAGNLTASENQKVNDFIKANPEALSDVKDIERAIVKLTASIAPNQKVPFNLIKDKLDISAHRDVVTMDSKKSSWFSYTSWAASLLLIGGLLWMFKENRNLNSEISTIRTEKDFLDIQIEKTNSRLTETQNLISILRNQSVVTIPLKGQPNFPNSYAKVYWDESNALVYMDLKGLPEPPEGKVYQIWSLTLNPLTPTSLGTINDFKNSTDKIFKLDNANKSQAFGITLEPVGGSASPTMDQLYTLGVINS